MFSFCKPIIGDRIYWGWRELVSTDDSHDQSSRIIKSTRENCRQHIIVRRNQWPKQGDSQHKEGQLHCTSRWANTDLKKMRFDVLCCFWFYCLASSTIAWVHPTSRLPRTRNNFRQQLLATVSDEEEVDVIVVGAGFGGLSCAALTSKYGFKTVCLEAHDTPGGVAHSFSRYSSISKSIPFRFDSGPSLITGLSSKSTNPLRQVLDAVGTADAVQWKTYDGWLVHDVADGKAFKLTAGSGGEFERAIEEKAGLV